MRLFSKKITIFTSFMVALVIMFANPIVSDAAETKLPAPQKYTYYWDGNVLQVEFTAIDGASEYYIYDVTTGDYVGKTNTSAFYNDLSNHSPAYPISYSYAVTAVPGNNSVNNSDYAVINISDYQPYAASVSDYYSAAFLSKEQLIKFIHSKGYYPTVDYKNDGTYVSLTIEKSEYDVFDGASDAVNGAWDAIDEYSDATDALSEILGKDDESEKKLKSNAKKALGIAGAFISVYDGINASKMEFTYFYPSGCENRSAKYMKQSYSATDNPEPDFSHYPQSKDGYYVANSDVFHRALNMKYTKSKRKWQITVMPGDYTDVYTCEIMR